MHSVNDMLKDEYNNKLAERESKKKAQKLTMKEIFVLGKRKSVSNK